MPSKLQMIRSAIFIVGLTCGLAACTHKHSHAYGNALLSDDQLFLDLNRLHLTLELSPEQEPLWEEASTVTSQLIRQNAINRNMTKERLRTALDDPLTDLQPLSDRIRKDLDAQSTLISTVLDRWLALDRSLLPKQKGVLRRFLRRQVELSEQQDARASHRGRGIEHDGEDAGYGRGGRRRRRD